jgi:drug/metabolite transporter (DMT)-like permease
MPEAKKPIPAVIYVVIAVLMWSTGGLFIKLTSLDAYQVTFFRSLLAGVTVLMFVVLKSRAASRRTLPELRINGVGIFASIIYATLLFLFVWATKHTTAANAIFLQYTAPIYILILGPFVIGEKFHLSDLVTVIFCIGGMSLFFVGKLEITDYQGNLAALGSGIFLGLYIMLLRHPKAVGTQAASLPASVVAEEMETRPVASVPESVAKGLNPVVTVIYGNLLLSLMTLPSGLAAFPTMTLKDAAAVGFLGIFQIGIAYILFIKGVASGTRPLDASIIGFIEPLLNPVWVFLFVGEQPSKWAILGGAIIIATVVLHTLRQYRSKREPPPP